MVPRTGQPVKDKQAKVLKKEEAPFQVSIFYLQFWFCQPISWKVNLIMASVVA